MASQNVSVLFGGLDALEWPRAGKIFTVELYAAIITEISTASTEVRQWSAAQPKAASPATPALATNPIVN